MKKSIFFHILAFVLSVLLSVCFLIAGSCLPQAPVDANILASVERMNLQGAYPKIADQAFASILDYETDALILAESKAITISDWRTIFTNPQFLYHNENAVEDLYNYASDASPVPGKYYVQYWMGFRPVIRLLLCFLDYYQILRYTALVFFILWAAVLCSVASHTDTKTAFLFALSIIFVRPHVISSSLQFSCCFLLAFPAMLLVPKIRENPRLETLFFLELGIATQFFDFYTTPVLTFGLPMIYLYLLYNRDHTAVSLKKIIGNALIWLAGYVLMWLAKLLLTTAFTPVNALDQGFGSFAGRIGIEKVSGLEAYYNPMAGIRAVAASLYSDREGKLILLAAVVLFCLFVLIRLLKIKPSANALFSHTGLLFLAALPVLWFAIAAQPTANHHWFQYRGIAASFWAGFMYLQLILKKTEPSM